MWQQQVLLLLVTSATVCLSAPSRAGLFELPIVHYNDFHARFEATSWTSGTCLPDKECVGGIARLYTAVKNTMEERGNHSVLINAGDNFQGTLWYNIHEWNVTVLFMNKFPHDAMGLGNHEFDKKIAGVIPYLEQLNCPVLAANIDDSDEPLFQGKYKEWIMIERGGRKIGIVGYMLSTTNEISSTENLRFTDEIEAVNRVTPLIKAAGANIIIAVSHSGIEIDMEVAMACPDVDIIVGGHSHTFLYEGVPPNNDTVRGNYPEVVVQTSGKRVLILQAYAYSKYLGNLTTYFDDNGDIDSWEGNPILLDSSIEEDAEVLEELKPWKEAVDAEANEPLGYTLVTMPSWPCGGGECLLGNFITDGMVYEHRADPGSGNWTTASIAATNSGGIRSDIDAGLITYGDLIMTQPFQNTFDTGELQGKHILEALEQSVSRPYSRLFFKDFSGQGFLVWSGLRVTFDMNQPIGSRVQGIVQVLCGDCAVPAFETLDMEKWYTLVLNSFLADGGDSYNVIKDNLRNRQQGRFDSDILRDYISVRSPINQALDGRIVIIQEVEEKGGAPSVVVSGVVLLLATLILSLV